MKITGNRLGVIAPPRVRRKRLGGPFPPWHDEVPPDTIDIELLPRINRYERGSLRFHQFGSTQRKLSERLAVFRDAMDKIEPGLAHSEAEMMDGLKEVMVGRRHMMTERQLRTFDLRAAIADSLDDESVDDESASGEEEVSENLSSILDDEIQGEGRARTSDIDVSEDQDQTTTGSQGREEDQEVLEGAPTQWLIDRLNAAGVS